MIEKRFLYFNTPAAFEAAKNDNQILDTSIVFVNGTSVGEDEDGQPIYDEDYPFIYTHGIKFAGGGGGGGSTVKPLIFNGEIKIFKSSGDFNTSEEFETPVVSHDSAWFRRNNTRTISVLATTGNKNVAIAYPETLHLSSAKLISGPLSTQISLAPVDGHTLSGYIVYKHVPLMQPGDGTYQFTF